jgi:two-component system LytT family response regulator
MRALIVDDERLARNELRRLLERFPEVEIAGEARNADEAFTQIEQLQPELLFLDIQMPGGDGFQLLERLETVPMVIFTTAYDQYALKAFEVSALDYLVKPIAPERLRAAMEKVTERNAKLEAAAPGPSALSARSDAAGQRVFVREGDRCWFVSLEEIALLESEGNYTRLFFGANKPLLLRSLNHLESRLPATLFFRANRRQIINLKFIESIDQWPNGGYHLKLRGGFEITMSRRQALSFQEATML